MVAGDKCIVAIGSHRGNIVEKTLTYDSGLLPIDMLKDGTIATIRRLHGDGWCSIIECNDYVYPLHLLKPLTPTKQLLKHIRSLDEHNYGT